MNYKTDWKDRPYTGTMPNYKPLHCSCGKPIRSIILKGKSKAIDLPCDCTSKENIVTDNCFYFDCLFNTKYKCRKGLKGQGIPASIEASKACYKERS
jgi:hypothetical protein